MIIDFKKHKSSKFFSKNPNILYGCFFLLIVATYLFLDKSFALFTQSLGPDLKGVLLPLYDLMDPFFAILVLSFLYFFVRFIQKREKKSRKFLYVSLTTTLSIFAAKILQVIIGRSSPDWLFFHGEMSFRMLGWNPHFHSFPSATSASIATVMTALSILNEKKSFLFFSLAIILGLIPAFVSLCFLSDALAGIMIGIVLCKYVGTRIQRELSIF